MKSLVIAAALLATTALPSLAIEKRHFPEGGCPTLESINADFNSGKFEKGARLTTLTGDEAVALIKTINDRYGAEFDSPLTGDTAVLVKFADDSAKMVVGDGGKPLCVLLEDFSSKELDDMMKD